ncbi:MAG TPA: integrase arm-type DNA-binding domain-containing protein [Geomonas sp.]
MKVTTFTDVMIRKLKPENKKYVRGEGNGFTVRVMPSGAKTWLYAYAFDGKRRELSLGCYPEVTLETARGKFEDARKQVKNGIDPLAEKKEAAEARRSELTFDQLAMEYLANNVEGQLVEKSVYYIKRILLGTGKAGAVDDFKGWRERKVSSITCEEASKLLKTVAARSPAAARNLLRTARPMFGYALPRGMVRANPFILADVKSFLSKPVRSKLDPTFKSRTLSEDEIRHLWKSLQAGMGSRESKDALRLMLLTGQRPSEVLGLNSSEIAGNWWTLPKDRTKARLDVNRTDHTVYLVPESLQIIGTKSGLIFESPLENQPIAINALGHMLRKNDYFGLPPWGAHDLRRTCRTFMSDIDGITTNAAEAILNHAKEGTARNYDQHKYRRQIENALTLWRDKLVEIIGGPLFPELPENVIPIKRAKA